MLPAPWLFARRGLRLYGSLGAFMMSPRRAIEMRVCCHCCHRPTRRNIGWLRRLANIWNATSMPMVMILPVAGSPVITIQAPSIRISSVMSCSSPLAQML